MTQNASSPETKKRDGKENIWFGEIKFSLVMIAHSGALSLTPVLCIKGLFLFAILSRDSARQGT